MRSEREDRAVGTERRGLAPAERGSGTAAARPGLWVGPCNQDTSALPPLRVSARRLGLHQAAGRGERNREVEGETAPILGSRPPQCALDLPGEPLTTPQQARPPQPGRWSSPTPRVRGGLPGSLGFRGTHRSWGGGGGQTVRTPARGPNALEGRGGAALLPGRGGRERRGHCQAGRCGAREGGWDLNAGL